MQFQPDDTWNQPNLSNRRYPLAIVKSRNKFTYYIFTLKNAHSSMKAFFADGIKENVAYDSNKLFMILRHPLDRWMSALNMYLDGSPGPMRGMKKDAHFTPQYLTVDGYYDLEKIRYYDYNKNIINDVIKGEHLFRYKKNRKPTINSRSNKIFRFDVDHNKLAYKQLPQILKGCKPEDYGLYPTLNETLECLNEEYKEDILFYNSRKFVNR